MYLVTRSRQGEGVFDDRLGTLYLMRYNMTSHRFIRSGLQAQSCAEIELADHVR